MLIVETSRDRPQLLHVETRSRIFRRDHAALRLWPEMLAEVVLADPIVELPLSRRHLINVQLLLSVVVILFGQHDLQNSTILIEQMRKFRFLVARGADYHLKLWLFNFLLYWSELIICFFLSLNHILVCSNSLTFLKLGCRFTNVVLFQS